MKNLVLGSLIAMAASTLGGCVIEDDNSCPIESGNITANWTVKDAATNSATSCPAGYPTAALYSQAVQPNGTPVGAPIIDLFDCDCGTGTTDLAPGLYDMWIEIATDNNGSQFAKSSIARVDLSNGPATFSVQILANGGYFSLLWNLKGAQSGNQLDCATAGATGGVSVIGTDVSSASNSNEDVFDCEDRAGTTAGYLQGTYTIAVDALNGADQAISNPVTLTNKVINDRNETTDLGLVEIPIPGK